MYVFLIGGEKQTILMTHLIMNEGISLPYVTHS